MIMAAFEFVDNVGYIQTGIPGETSQDLLARTQRGMERRYCGGAWQKQLGVN